MAEASQFENSFAERILEVRQWCLFKLSMDISPKTALRSIPVPLRASGTPIDLQYEPAEQRSSIIEQVAKTRRKLCREHNIQHVDSTVTRVASSLLLYLPDFSLNDGISEISSAGFFDVNDAPPQDTWLWYVDGPAQDKADNSYLISWVPDVFKDVAKRGVLDNASDCLQWGDSIIWDQIIFPDWLKSFGVQHSK